MNIKIHRGLEQIGGCITEISTATTRIFIDFGQNLPGYGEQTTPEQDEEMVREILAHNTRENEAVFYTHAHEDHVGLFIYIPSGISQYIGEGGKEILLEKYKLIKAGHIKEQKEISSLSAHNGSISQAQSAERLKLNIRYDEATIKRIESFITWQRTKPHAVPNSITVGDICITPFFNSHSIYDSYMFLIEADGKRIWHTGDYRKHGYLGKGLIPTLKHYATNIDVLITEGTMLSRTDECIHENEVSRKMANAMDSFKYVVILASATDIERLAAIKEAARKVHKSLYVCSSFMKKTMAIFTKREAELSKNLFEFHPRFVSPDEPKIEVMKKKGFVIVTSVAHQAFVEKLTEGLDPNEVLFIYSSWDGYYKDPAQVDINPQYSKFRKAFLNAVDIHTSGHADRKTIEEVVRTVNAKEVMVIHKEKDATL